MGQLTAKQKVAAVWAWQGCGMLHPLTCGKNSNHANLVPRIMKENGKNRVILVCLDCEYAQGWVPEVVLEFTEQKARELETYWQQRLNESLSSKNTPSISPNPALEQFLEKGSADAV